MFKHNKVYDVLKWVAIFFLPALAKMITGIFGTWGIPYGAEIADTLTYIQVFLGAILCVSSVQYYVSNKTENKEEAGTEEDE